MGAFFLELQAATEMLVMFFGPTRGLVKLLWCDFPTVQGRQDAFVVAHALFQQFDGSVVLLV